MVNNPKFTVTSHQAFALLISFMIGAGFLILPARGVAIMRHAAWLPVLIIGVASILIVYLMTKAMSKCPSMTIIEINQYLLGPFIGGILSILFFTINFSIVPIELNVLADLTLVNLIPDFPEWAIIVPFIFVACYLVEKGMPVMLRVLEILLPIGLFFVVFVLVLVIRNIDLIQLYPADLALSRNLALPTLDVAFSFGGMAVLLIVFPYLRRPERVTSIGVWAVVVTLLVYLAFTVACVGVFGPGEIEQWKWPVIELAKSVNIRGLFIHRLDIVFVVLWLMSIFTTTVTALFAAVYVFQSVFPINQSYVIYGLGALSLIAAIYGRHSPAYAQIQGYVSVGVLAITFIFPLLLWLGSLFKKAPQKALNEGQMDGVNTGDQRG